jgi:hypothetical protein
MAVLVTAIHAFELARHRDVGGRDIRAFTPVFDGLLPGHDEAGLARLGMKRHGRAG